MSIHHSERHFRNNQALRDIVIGMSDGLTVPFALAAGLSGAHLANSIIVTAGLAELIAGAISMGLGGYLAGKSDLEHYRGELRRERAEIEAIPEEEKKEVRDVLKKFGISNETQTHFVNDLAKNKPQWLAFMMEFELGLHEPHPTQATWGALRIGLSYGIGGMIPLAAYFFTPDARQGLFVSSLLTAAALAVFGAIKSHFLNQPRLKGALRVLAVGALAAAVAYGLARQFT